MKRILVFAFLLSLGLGALPALADDVIYRGIDLWKTVSSGTFNSFAEEPIPAGFFCESSAAWTGRIDFKGVPLATSAGSALGDTDTIVERLDDATFNAKGVAVTRVQVRALQFQSLAPIETDCGTFNVQVVLSGKQPITRMEIFRENDLGGRFLAPIWVDIEMIFTPVGAKGGQLSLTRSLRFRADPRAPWASSFAEGERQWPDELQVDTNADGVAEAWMPGTSNFAAGYLARSVTERDPTPLNHSWFWHEHETRPPSPW